MIFVTVLIVLLVIDAAALIVAIVNDEDELVPALGFVGFFLICWLFLAISHLSNKHDSAHEDVKYVFLPEEYKAIEKGDTLIIYEQREGIMEIGFYHKGMDSSNLYIVK